MVVIGEGNAIWGKVIDGKCDTERGNRRIKAYGGCSRPEMQYSNIDGKYKI